MGWRKGCFPNDRLAFFQHLEATHWALIFEQADDLELCGPRNRNFIAFPQRSEAWWGMGRVERRSCLIWLENAFSGIALLLCFVRKAGRRYGRIKIPFLFCGSDSSISQKGSPCSRSCAIYSRSSRPAGAGSMCPCSRSCAIYST